MTNAEFKYWNKEGHILIQADNWDCFLHNSSLNPMINWLNLHHQDIESGKPVESATINGVQYLSVNGNLAIRTERDFVLLNTLQLIEFITWLNNHKKILNIRDVWP